MTPSKVTVPTILSSRTGSLPERMKSPVQLMQPAQRSWARNARTLAGQSRNRGLVASDPAVASAPWIA
jgi:hypothetical protein